MSTLPTILIANRGEIAFRIIQTARQLGYRTIAIFTDVDANSRHVKTADNAVNLGSAAENGYLNQAQIIQAAKDSGAQFIHPGYGFLAENADFARHCEQHQIQFIGPPATAIAQMGDKQQAKLMLQQIGVPCIVGITECEQSDSALLEAAKTLTFPIMIKAAAGGGGRGMRLVQTIDEFIPNLHQAQTEAQKAFGDATVILEQALLHSRHIEIQIVIDQQGKGLFLWERDCSTQRRHQKIIEEAPAPGIDKNLRYRMGETALQVARSCGYIGVGTIEFLLTPEKEFYFLEMNTRLQVEHPITEAITGIDLVAWQIRIAEGKPLPMSQEDIPLQGHAIEARLYAEDPKQSFLPQTGTVHHWQIPPNSGHIRIDHSLQSKAYISPYYDPMIAKVITIAENREIALRRLTNLLGHTQLLGINNNKAFLIDVLQQTAMQQGIMTTDWLDQHNNELTTTLCSFTKMHIAQAAAFRWLQQCRSGPWQSALQGWSNSATRNYHYVFAITDNSTAAQNTPSIFVEIIPDHMCNSYEHDSCQVNLIINIEDNEIFDQSASNLQTEFIFSNINYQNTLFTFQYQHVSYSLCCLVSENNIYMDTQQGHFVIKDITHEPNQENNENYNQGDIITPIDGTVSKILVTTGESIISGQNLLVIEAMKIEHQINAAQSGTISEIKVAVGDSVKRQQILVLID